MPFNSIQYLLAHYKGEIMKKTILLLICVSFHTYTYAKWHESFLEEKGESITLRPNSTPSIQFYLPADTDGSWISTSEEIFIISEHQTCKIEENSIVLEPDTLILDEKEKIKIYKTWVTLNTSGDLFKGVLYEVNDSSITLSNSYAIIDYVENSFKTMTFQVSNIKRIKTRKRKFAVRGIWIGAVAGFGAAMIWGYTSHGGGLSPSDATLEGLSWAIPTAAIGAGVGAMIESLVRLRIPITIHGNLDKYNSHKKKLKRRSLR